MSSEGPVLVLAGGTGGGKLAAGFADLLDGRGLTVIANTGDDLEIHGGHVSPDPDLCLYWLAGRIDERGWGLREDSFTVMDGLRELGEDVWFSLGDRDLAVCLQRARRLAEGLPLSETLRLLGDALGVSSAVLPMCDEPVRTWVRVRGRWTAFQEFMIREGGEGPVQDVAYRGIEAARISPQVAEAVAGARVIVIGPSNPVASIRPVLAVPGMADALRATPAPVVAVSPLVGGRVLKGPTKPFMAWAGLGLDADGIAAAYDGMLDGMVADEPCGSLPTLQTDVLMADAAGRRRLAAETLTFAGSLAGAG